MQTCSTGEVSDRAQVARCNFEVLARPQGRLGASMSARVVVPLQLGPRNMSIVDAGMTFSSRPSRVRMTNGHVENSVYHLNVNHQPNLTANTLIEETLFSNQRVIFRNDFTREVRGSPKCNCDDWEPDELVCREPAMRRVGAEHPLHYYSVLLNICWSTPPTTYCRDPPPRTDAVRTHSRR
jgi:hypothetical protein